jgi:hypothetical protein
VRGGGREMRRRHRVGPQIGVAVDGEGRGELHHVGRKTNDRQRNLDGATARPTRCPLASGRLQVLGGPPRVDECDIGICIRIHQGAGAQPQ